MTSVPAPDTAASPADAPADAPAAVFTVGVTNDAVACAVWHAIASGTKAHGQRGRAWSCYYTGVYRAECGRDVVRRYSDAHRTTPEPWDPEASRNCKACEKKIAKADPSAAPAATS